jgi:hypothetical protein
VSNKSLIWFLPLAQAAATVAILIRCAFRVAELSGGFKGRIWVNEVDYMILEGGMVTFGVILLTVAHPGIGFCDQYQETNYKMILK